MSPTIPFVFRRLTAPPWSPLRVRLPGSRLAPSARALPAPAPIPGIAVDCILESGDAALDPDALLARLTPVGLTEQELLIALNQRDLAGLTQFPGFGPKVAGKILEFRATEKFLSSLDELVRVPLIGAVRFRRLVGRESQFFTLALHSTLRIPAPRDIRTRDLRPLLWAAPGLPRIYLGSSSDQDAEDAAATLARHKLTTRRVGEFVLYFHFTALPAAGWSAQLLSSLPRTLRRILQPAAPVPPSEPPAPAPAP